MYTLDLPLPPTLSNTYNGKHTKERGRIFFNLTKNYVLSNNLELRANIPLSIEIHFTFASVNSIHDRVTPLLDSLVLSNVIASTALVSQLIVHREIGTPGAKVILSEYQ